MTLTSVLSSNVLRRLPILALAVMATIPVQQILAEKIESSTPETAPVALPDSPGALLYPSLVSSSSLGDAGLDGQATGAGAGASSKPVALPRVKFVSSEQTAPKQVAHDKIRLGLRESVTPFSMLGWVFSAGWSAASRRKSQLWHEWSGFLPASRGRRCSRRQQGDLLGFRPSDGLPSGSPVLSAWQDSQIFQSRHLCRDQANNRPDRQRKDHSQLCLYSGHWRCRGAYHSLLPGQKYDYRPGLSDMGYLSGRLSSRISRE